MARFLYSQEHIDFICSLNHLKRKDIADKMNAKFGTKIHRRTVNQILLRHGYKASSNGQFTKGQKTWSKGLKGYMGANKTSFKKGNIPHNLKPMFHERVDRDGYVLIKTEDGYIPKARYVYEKHHGIKLNNKQIVIFLDNDKQNFDIDNLRAVTWKENGLMSGNKYHALPPELKEVAVNIVKVEGKILERKESQ